MSVLAGDRRAFAALFDDHHPAVFRSIQRLGATHHEAEDAMAAAFFELWRRRADVRVVGGSVLPWLIATALNAHRNRVRTAMRYRAILARMHAADAEPDPALDAEERVFAGQRAAALRASLRSLTPADAALVVLVDLENQDQREVADLLGIRPGALRVRLHRARTRLRIDLLTSDPHLFSPEETS